MDAQRCATFPYTSHTFPTLTEMIHEAIHDLMTTIGLGWLETC